MRRIGIIMIFVAVFLGLTLVVLVKKRQEILKVEKSSTPYSIEYVKNLIFNSGFEIGWGSLASGWRFESNTYKAYFDRDVIEKFEGKFSANINSDISPSNSFIVQSINEFPKEKKFILYGAVKTYAVDSVFMRIEVYDTLGNLKSFNSTDILRGTSDWKVYSCAVIVGKDAKKIEVKCILFGKGRAWFDDVELVAVKYSEKDYPFWWRYWTKQFAK